MSLFEKLKLQIKEARISGAPSLVFLTTLLAEALAVSKRELREHPFDSEIVTVAEKYRKGIRENLDKFLAPGDERRAKLEAEDRILDDYIPAKVSGAALVDAVAAAAAELAGQGKPLAVGPLMGALKGKFGQSLDGKAAKLAVESFLQGVA